MGTRVLLVLGALAVVWLLLETTDLRGSAGSGGTAGSREEIRSLAELERELMEEMAHGPALRGLPGIEHRVTGHGVVQGRVVLHVADGTPQPLPGVAIQLLGQDPGDGVAPHEDPRPVRFTVATEEDGRFTLPDVPAGTSFVLLLDHVPYRRIVMRGLAVHADQTTDVGTLTLGAPTTLHGEVVDAKGRPVAGAIVRVLRDQSRRSSFDARRALFELQNEEGHLAESRAEGTGQFAIRDLPPGRYVLRASAAGYATTFRRDVLVTVDENSSAVRVVMDAGAGLEGRVLDEAGRGIGGARVIAVAIPGLNLTRLDRVEVRADEDGHYLLDTLIPGMGYGVEAWGEGYAPTGRMYLPLPAGITHLDWRLKPSGRIEGRVVDAETGAGVAGCRVMVLAGPLMGASPVSTTTDESGAFALTHVNAGPVLLFSATAEGYQSLDEFDMAAVRGLRVTAGETLWVDWQVRAGGAVEGRVVSDAGGAVPYASVALVDRDRGRQRWTGEITGLTDAQGRYRLLGVRVGTYDVRVVASGYAPPTESEVTQVEMVAALGVVTRDVVLRRGGVLEGTVNAPDGAAVRGARVELDAADGTTHRDSLRDLTAVSAANGAFRIAGVPPGVEVLVRADHDTWVHSEPMPVRLTPGGTRKVTLRLREGAKLPGRVVDVRGAAVAEARVRWGSVEGVRERDLRDSFNADAHLGARVLRTDADGRFLVEGLAPGALLLKVEQDGYAAWYRRDVPIEGEGLQPALTVELTSTLTIQGRVRSEGTGGAIPRAFVYARERGPGEGQAEDPGRVQAVVSAETDAQGRYVLSQVPPGTHEVIVWYAEGHVAAAQDWRNAKVRQRDVAAGASGVDFALDATKPPDAPADR